MRSSETSLLALVAVALLAVGCTTRSEGVDRSAFVVAVVEVNGVEPPTVFNELPKLAVNLGDVEEHWRFHAEAMGRDGELDTGFNGFARVSVVPGSVRRVVGEAGQGRNVRFINGRAEATAVVIGTFGDSRLWIEDIGYIPAQPGQVPACADGIDNDGDKLIDFPNDPGCAFADDMTEEAGTLTTGVSQAIRYELPTIADVQGHGSETPFPSVALQIKTSRPNDVIVTRVSSGGFYVTDLGDPLHPMGHNHLFAFNFNPPPNMRVCDKLSFLSGTAIEFFGLTEITFPSYEVTVWDQLGADCRGQRLGGPVPDFTDADQWCRDSGLGDYCRLGRCQPCPMPEPVELTEVLIASPVEMEKLESGLVRVDQFRIAPLFGPNTPVVSGSAPNYGFEFGPSASNCDLNGDGTIDFFDDLEGGCSNACAGSPDCSDWQNFSARGNFKISRAGVMLQANTSTAGGFDPVANKGQTISWLTGTLHHFSGGRLNHTIELRCADDLICDFDDNCAKDEQGNLLAAPVPDNLACSLPPIEDDNDAATN